MLCCWAQNTQMHEVLTSEEAVTELPLQGSPAAYLAQTVPRGRDAADLFWWLGSAPRGIN